MSYITIKLRRGTAAQWTAQNPVLAEGEFGAETDTRKFKIGNGVGAWNSLQYWGGSGGGATLFTDLTDVPQSYTGQGGKLVRVKADATGLEFYTLTIAAGDLPTGIDAAKIADGTISNTEFQYLNGVTSSIQTQLNSKQASLGFTAEDVANKSTSVTTDQASNTKYPSVKAVYDWAVATFTTTAAVASQITTALSGYATQAFVTSQGYITNVITALGYTPENVANKKLNLSDNSDTFYPSQKAVKTAVDAKQDKATFPVVIQIAASDLTTAITSGTNKAYFRSPFAFTLTGVRASLLTAQSSGSIFTVDINEAGSSVLSTKLTIDNTEKTSTTAATAAVISDSSIADDAEISIDVDQAGTGAAGLVVTLIGTRSV